MRTTFKLLAPLACLLGAGAVLAINSCSQSAAQTDETDWPVELSQDGTTITLYEPVAATLQDDRLSARAAVSAQRPADAAPLFGAVWLDARLVTDRDARTATLLDAKASQVTFPDAGPDEAALAAIVEARLPTLEHTFSLDRLEAMLDDDPPREGNGLQHAPPHIVFAKVPTALVTLDGPPRMQKVEGSDVLRVANTPFVILLDETSGTFWLRMDTRWASAARIEGPWREGEPPAAVVAALPAPAQDAPPDPHADLAIVTATEPTELIVSDGEPTWTPLVGSELLYLENSDEDVFLKLPEKECFVLLSGRWYRSASLETGPWTYVRADELPPAFAQIPAGSPREDVRAFVAGTDEAHDALLDAAVPQTSAIPRSDTSCTVSWDGDPQFAPIEGTRMHYAVNTPDAVVELDGAYFGCQGGVWYTSASPLGPWTVCASVPAELYTIPPSCPIYPAIFVHVYGATPDVVYVGYLPGYTGCYVDGPTVVYGTGWWYHGWYGTQYFPHPCTWGFAAHYEPWGCGWCCGPGFGWGWSPGWFWADFGWGWPGWWGPGGFHCNHFDIHEHVVHVHVLPPRPVTAHHVRTTQAHPGHANIYEHEAFRARNAAVSRAAPGASPWVPSRQADDVYVDDSGRVLRRTPQGWQERGREGWRPAPQAAPIAPTPPRAPPAIQRPAPVPTRPGVPPPPPSLPRRPEPPTQRPVTPPRTAPEQMNRSRERGSSRESGFRQRTTPPPRPPR